MVKVLFYLVCIGDEKMFVIFVVKLYNLGVFKEVIYDVNDLDVFVEIGNIWL